MTKSVALKHDRQAVLVEETNNYLVYITKKGRMVGKTRSIPVTAGRNKVQAFFLAFINENGGPTARKIQAQ